MLQVLTNYNVLRMHVLSFHYGLQIFRMLLRYKPTKGCTNIWILPNGHLSFISVVSNMHY